MTTLHLVIGPDQHGVVLHGAQVAGWCGQPIVRLPDTARLDNFAAGRLAGADVVHVPFTDRLFGHTLHDASAAFDAVRDLVARSGAALSVTLHDIPHDDSPLQRERRALYRRVIAASHGVVVNSRTELRLVQDDAGHVHSLRVVPLPIIEAGPRGQHEPRLPPNGVGVLGFVYPDRGYDAVLDALPTDGVLIAVGRPADGHDDLARDYAARAGARWHMTGYVPDADLADHLAQIAVPIAPNPRVTASASINTWIAHGRRPLVAGCAYTREIARTRPGTVTVYDPADPPALRAAVRRALDDPSLTWLEDPPAADSATTAEAYLTHLAACRPDRARPAGAGRVVVPRNRWDLIDRSAPARPSVSVVVPYFAAPDDLRLVLTALRAQDHPHELLEVVVADDGSAEAPDLDAGGDLAVSYVRQPDHGFRAAAARNLGAAAASGDILVFLDQDTVPEPGFVSALVELPARCRDVVAVGRRRHADLAGMSGRLTPDWPAQARAGELDDPGWLREAYRDSGDLLDVDRRSYRYVISAVLAVDSRFFAELGGFDERFVGYGGEDWDFAHRARVGGAVLAHVPDALAWHNGPDWALRGDEGARRAQKAGERDRLAELLPDPDARSGTGGHRYPSVVVRATGFDSGDALAAVRSAAGADCGFWFDAVRGSQADTVLAEPDVFLGEPPADVLTRAWAQAWVSAPADLRDLMALAEQADTRGCVETPSVVVRASCAVNRAARYAALDESRDDLADLLFGRQQRVTPDE